MRESAQYQPEIDGLRAVAIISVLLFHLGLSQFSGGFVGVDVFFVISGYLISRLIVTEIEATGQFGFKQFYIRRSRRLFPALFVSLALTTVGAILLFSPEDLTRFGGSLLASIFSLSNFYFWNESGYFDADAAIKPLLHTWSLAVEEQFYLFWPLFMVWAMKWKHRALLVVGAAGLASFALNAVFMDLASSLIKETDAIVFFLMPFRVFEFGVGAALVWIIPRLRLTQAIAEILLVAGLVMIIAPVLTYDETAQFPYWAALPPCLGAASIIVSISRPGWAAMLLNNPVATAIGAISYSLYLVHWPIMVFLRYVDLRALGYVQMAQALAASLALGAAMHLLVERRFRYHHGETSRSIKPAALAFTGLATLVSVLGLSMQLGNGWKWRIPVDQLHSTNQELREEENSKFCSAIDPSKPANIFTCQLNRNKARDIIIWGDSHAMHLVGGFAASYLDHNIYVLYQASCVPQSGFGGYVMANPSPYVRKKCVARNEAAWAYLSKYKSSTIILTSAKRDKAARQALIADEMAAKLQSVGHQVVYLGDFIRPSRKLNDCRSVPAWLMSNANISKRCSPVAANIKVELAYNLAAAGTSRNFINPAVVQCGSGKCQYFDGPKPLFRDDHHLSWEGAQYFIAKLKPMLPIK